MKIYKDFKYEIINNEVTITEYIGNETNVIIPFKIKGYSVTNIGSCTFEDCTSLTDITIPNSVISIGGHAFYNCSSLTSVRIPNSVTRIWEGVFAWCSSLTSVNIPNSVTWIGRSAFKYCSSLKSVSIPNSVTYIGKRAFECCSSLTSVINNYKAFDIENNKLICMNNCEFKENEWSDNIDNLELCGRGYHYCTNLFEVFSYYCGRLDEDIAIYECEVGDVVVESDTSKCVTNRIKPVKRLYREDVIKILNNTN